MSVLSREEIRAPASDGLAAVLPRADDQVRVAVTIDIARNRRARAEPLAGSLAGEGEEPLPVGARIDVHAAGRRALRAVRPVGRVDVGDTIAVHVAGDRHE